MLLITGAIGAINGIAVALLRSAFHHDPGDRHHHSWRAARHDRGSPAGSVSPLLAGLFNGKWLGAPPIIYLLVCLIFLVSLVQRHASSGRMLYAIGASPDAAYIAGLPVKGVTILCYTISGAAAGLAGILVVGFSEGATMISGDGVLDPVGRGCVVIGGHLDRRRPRKCVGAAWARCCLDLLNDYFSAGHRRGWRILLYGIVILIALLLLSDELRIWVRRAVSTSPRVARFGTWPSRPMVWPFETEPKQKDTSDV